MPRAQITVDPCVMMGKPVVAGTRITVESILERLGAGETVEQILEAHPRLTAEGQGRPGFVKGSSAIALRPDGAATIVDVNGTVQTGGPIARLGQRLVGSVSKMMMDRFFACLQSRL